MITRGNEDPGIDCDQLVMSTDNEIRSKGRRTKTANQVSKQVV
jgi:hypothetical protein